MATKIEKAYIKSSIPNKKVSDKILDMIDQYDHGGGGSASDVTFDPSGTDLSATNVQDAIIEVYENSSGSSKYVLNFNSTSDWTNNGSFYEINISVSNHNKGTSPNCKVYENISFIFHEVMTVVMMDNLGNITIQVTQIPDNRFAGKLTIE